MLRVQPPSATPKAKFRHPVYKRHRVSVVREIMTWRWRNGWGCWRSCGRRRVTRENVYHVVPLPGVVWATSSATRPAGMLRDGRLG